MDPISAISVAGVVVQFVKLGLQVVKKLSEYSEIAPGESPRSLRSINIRLPLVINALSRIQTEAEVSSYDPEVRSILHGVVLGCFKLVQELDEIAAKIRPRAGENMGSRVKKVFSSLKSDTRIEEIDLGLQGYISVLVLHRVVDRTAANVLPIEESTYFEVRQKRVGNPIARDELITKLDQCFFKAARGQNETPEYVVLFGDEGAGKSQLALEYCHQAFDVGQFQTVFWLDGSTPAAVKLDLESVASVIRKTKKGTSEEKLKFVDAFLTERWHPWLLVVDNYQHKEFHTSSLNAILPKKGNGAVIITTQDYDMPPMGTVVKVYKFLTAKEETSLRYKMTIALRSKDLDAVKAVLDQGLPVDRPSRTVWDKDSIPLVNVAAEAEFDEALKILLDLGANPHLDMSTYSVLGSAIYGGSVSTVTLVLDHEDKTEKRSEDKEYDHAFGIAIRESHIPILKLMLQKRGFAYDADSRRTREGFVAAAENWKIDVFRALHSLNKLPASKETKIQALCKAIGSKDLDLIKFFINEAGLKPDEQDNSGESPLYYAVNIGNSEKDVSLRDEVVSLLLAAGAPPDMGKKWGSRTPLHHMAAYGCTSTIRLLLQHGADVTVENEDKVTPLLMALDYKSTAAYPILVNEVDIPDAVVRKAYFSRPMHVAAKDGDRELGLLLLPKSDIDAVEPSSGDTPLLAAIRKDRVAMARMLIRHKAKQTIPDKTGTIIPMLLAADRGLELVVRDLSKAADSPGLEVRDDQGCTPLILAARGDHQKAVKVLLGLGADRDATNQFGETALDIAEEKDLEEVVKMLSDL